MSKAARRSRSALLPPPPRHSAPGLVDRTIESWSRQSMSLRVLRAFLGVTFLYAGAQKLLDPNFLRAGTPDYIGSQLQGFAQGSPIAGVLRILEHAPALAGIGIALTEIAIGVGTLAGIAPGTMAVGGFLVNLTLTLSATWHVHPYFLGSDSIYAVGWLTYGIGLVEARRAALADVRRSRGRPAAMNAPGLGRRELLRGGALAGATLATAAVATALSGAPASAIRREATGARGSGHTHGGSSPSSPPTQQAPTQGTPVAQLSSIPVGGAVGFQAPGVGPAALVRLSTRQVVAYSRVCTHAGCLVGYDQAQRILYCPCHGAEYDPAHGARVIAGPAPTPLQSIPVEVDRATGEVVIPNA